MTEPDTESANGLEEEHNPENERSPIRSLTGDDWEKTADDILVESSFDTNLGKQMSRDAIRTSQGEMSEAEFYEKYHSEVIEEFGVDNRPIPASETDD